MIWGKLVDSHLYGYIINCMKDYINFYFNFFFWMSVSKSKKLALAKARI